MMGSDGKRRSTVTPATAGVGLFLFFVFMLQLGFMSSYVVRLNDEEAYSPSSSQAAFSMSTFLSNDLNNRSPEELVQEIESLRNEVQHLRREFDEQTKSTMEKVERDAQEVINDAVERVLTQVSQEIDRRAKAGRTS
mmetsp:Transcript_89219/g.133751  ORF Transcript_89219/g.133751 Transcript_89219/m.133751 type:complete len:137 (-) Transcript_89219:126-536(-)